MYQPSARRPLRRVTLRTLIAMLVLPAWYRPITATEVTGATTTPPLGPIPTACPTNPPPVTINPALGKAIGMSPAWAIGFSPGLTLAMGNPRFIAHGPHGWYAKIMWVVAPGYRRPVMLHGSALDGGAPLWFQIGNRAPSTAPTLDLRAPPVPQQPAGWASFPSYLFIPRAGCYAVEASWPGGMWRLTFAAGRSTALGGA